MARYEKIHGQVQDHTSLGSFTLDKPPVTEDYLAFRVEYVDIEETGSGQVNLEVIFCDADGAPQLTVEDVKNTEVAWWHYPSTIITDGYDFGWLLLSEATADALEVTAAAEGKWPSGGSLPLRE